MLHWFISHLYIYVYAAAAAKLLQSYPTLYDPTDGSPPGSSVPGILQARTLEWVAISVCNACMLSLFSHVWLCMTLWAAAHQAPLSTGFSRQEHWSGLPFSSPNLCVYIFPKEKIHTYMNHTSRPVSWRTCRTYAKINNNSELPMVGSIQYPVRWANETFKYIMPIGLGLVT